MILIFFKIIGNKKFAREGVPMISYEKLPTDVLLDFFNEINQNIIKGILSKIMYYELGLIIIVMNRRGITLNKPVDFEKVVDQQLMENLST
ncbi:hypothetical protein [Bacillus sp. X1(2014)]|uniref:hypothetical protein n=1 Tax=Bacillus sp. X1(2014) TaxID=1565991 RepID=UPI00119EE06A|nr:hypothetical protein [Bacillus sp. X1(2014)]